MIPGVLGEPTGPLIIPGIMVPRYRYWCESGLSGRLGLDGFITVLESYTGMAVSIKDPETDRLIRELARRTGETQVGAIKAAVAERLARWEREQTGARQRRMERLRAIVQDLAPRLAAAPESTQIADHLYDDQGMPA